MSYFRVLLAASLLALFAWGPFPAYADAPTGHGKGHGGRTYGSHGGHQASGHRGSTGHFLRHLIHHADEIGLSEEQVAKIKTIQLNLDTTRIKAEADIMVAERELKALLEDEKSEMAAIEGKIKQSETLEADLRIAAIKARRETTTLLTPEQREKERAVHARMMQQHRGSKGGGMMGHGKKGGCKHCGMMGGHGQPTTPQDQKKAQEQEAEQDEEKEKIEMAGKATVTFDQAAQTATQKTAGKVIEVELEEEDDRLVWEVEIVTAAGQLEEIYVDAVAGGVVEIKEDEKEAGKEQEGEKK